MVFVSNILHSPVLKMSYLKFIDTLMNRPVIIVDMRNHHIWVLGFPDDCESDEEQGVFPTKQEAYEYFDSEEMEKNHETILRLFKWSSPLKNQ